MNILRNHLAIFLLKQDYLTFISTSIHLNNFFNIIPVAAINIVDLF